MSTGKKIREARISKGWTQSELAERCGLSLRTIQRMEKEENQASLYTAGKIAEVLEIKISLDTPSPDQKTNSKKTLKPMQILSSILPMLLFGSGLLASAALGWNFLNPSSVNSESKEPIEIQTVNCGTESECDIQVTRKNLQGDILWQKTYGGSSYDKASAVLPSQDGGFFVLGSTSSFGEGNYDVWLIKVDQNGNLLWQKTFGGFFNEYASSISYLENGKGINIEAKKQKCSTPNVSEDCFLEAWTFYLDLEGELIGQS
ncbi:MAG: helix-turn-helix domain-containing protein [Cyclobacteriaceae bacterium]|nr:helix-turn-helix domain-containing protein [Cyclobacteriaceae bacterium]MDX5465599.1 helix-turn-helix domain-containing protein [Cyclobacteriaceae bacterium]